MTKSSLLRLLIVDRDSAVCGSIAATASSLGFEICQAHTGRAALACFAEAQPGLVFLDPQLADMSGYSLLSQWTASAPRVQIAIVTADRGFDSVLQAMRMGACDYLAKPFDAAQLRAMLLRIQQKLLSPEHQPGSLQPEGGIQPVPGSEVTRLSEIERTTIERVFHQVNGDKAMAGKLLGISRATLYRKLKRYQIHGCPPGARACLMVLPPASQKPPVSPPE